MIDISHFVAAQRNRPLSIAVAVSAVFVPSSLIIFLSKPALYTQLGINGVILLSTAISLPILLLCYGLWYTPLKTILQLEQRMKGETDEPDLLDALKSDDLLEWPCLFAAGWTTHLILYGVAGFAYFRPIRIGATLLLTAAIIAGVWILVFIGAAVLTTLYERSIDRPAQRSRPT